MSVIIKGYEKPKRCVECIGCFANMCMVHGHDKCPLDGTPEWCPMERIDKVFEHFCDDMCYYMEIAETQESLHEICERCELTKYCRSELKKVR